MTDEVYTLSVSSKRYSFPAGSRTFTLRDNVSDMNFIAAPVGESLVSDGPAVKSEVNFGRKSRDQ
jgi:hypothetical protein